MPTDPPKADPPNRKRRWFQFSLRTLFLFVVIVATASCWLSAFRDRKLEQRRVVASLRHAGADVAYDYEFDSTGARISGSVEPPGPRWIRCFFSDDVFAAPSYLGAHLRESAPYGLRKDIPGNIPLCASDQEILGDIGKLTSLTCVALSFDRRSSEPFDAIEKLPNLEKLTIEGQLDGLVGLPPILRVTHLTLKPSPGIGLFDGCEFDESIGERVKQAFPSLRTLIVSEITNRGIESLSGMTNLESLRIETPFFRPAERIAIHDCPRLKAIKVMPGDGYETSYESLDLANLPALESLDVLWRSSIRLSGLPKLAKLNASSPWLRHLSLEGMENLEEVDVNAGLLPAVDFAQLEKCPKLATLRIHQSFREMNIEAVMEEVARISSLESIELICMPLTDGGLARLQSLPRLKNLNLIGTEMTNANLAVLMRFKSLRTLHVTWANRDQVKRLQAAIPGLECKVDGARQTESIQ